jgi:hypothetical protein
MHQKISSRARPTTPPPPHTNTRKAHVHALVVIHKVAVRHEGEGLGIAVPRLGGRHHSIVDQPRQEGCTRRGREAHVGYLCV